MFGIMKKNKKLFTTTTTLISENRPHIYHSSTVNPLLIRWLYFG